MPDDIQSTDAATAGTSPETTSDTSAQSAPSGETTPGTDTSTAATAQVPATPNPDANAAPGSLPSQTRSAPNKPNTAPQLSAKPGLGTAPPQVHDWEKRYRDQSAALQQAQLQQKQYQEKMRQWEGLDPNHVRQLLEKQQQQAATQNLKPWHPRHPEASQTMARLQRVEAYRSAVRGLSALPEEQRAQAAQNMANEMGVTPEDAQLYRDHESSKQRFVEEFHRDPESKIQDIAREVAYQAVQEFEQFNSLRGKTQQFLTENQELVQKHAQEIDWAMNHPARREVGIEFARLKAENDALKAKQAGALEAQETANAQKALTRRRAHVTGDQNGAPIIKDPVAEAEAEGLTEDQLADRLIRSRRLRTA